MSEAAPPPEGVPGGWEAELRAMSAEVGQKGGGKAENRSHLRLARAAVVEDRAAKGARTAQEPRLRVRAARASARNTLPKGGVFAGAQADCRRPN